MLGLSLSSQSQIWYISLLVLVWTCTVEGRSVTEYNMWSTSADRYNNKWIHVVKATLAMFGYNGIELYSCVCRDLVRIWFTPNCSHEYHLGFVPVIPPLM